MELLLSVFNFIFLIVVVLLGVAFITLFERKILGYVHIRKGPNIVGYWGILQPMADAVKLFIKEQTFLFRSNYFIYYLSPSLNMCLSLSCWLTLPFVSFFFSFNYSILFFLCCTALSVYSLLSAGWSSNSKYSLIGSLRCVAQTISYEVSLALIILCFIFLTLGYSFLNFFFNQYYIWFIFLMIPLSFMVFVSMLAETNRSPFDFAEGESELVSGFNIEYSSGGFAILFMAEYASILFMSGLMVVIMMGGSGSDIVFFLKLGLLMYLFILIRGTVPRFRYDKLMFLCWKIFLPSILFLLYFFAVMAVIF